MQLSEGKSYVKLAKNIGFLTIGNFASKLLNYFLVPLYTNVLSTEQFGIADLITTTIALLIPLFSLQISEAVMRFLLDKENTELVLGSAFRILISGMIIATLCSPVFLLFDSVAEFYGLFLLLLYADIIYTFLGQFIKGIEKVFVYSISGVINTFVVAITNIIFLKFFDMGVEGYLLSFILGYLSSIIYMVISSRKYVRKNWIKHSDNELIKKMLIYSVPLIPNAMCWWINSSSDKFVVTLFCGASAVGIYAVAYKIPSLLATFMNIFFGAWQISAVENFGSKESKLFFSDIFKKTLLLNVFASVLLIGSAKVLGRILFAKDFFVAWKYTILLVVAYFFSTMASFMGTIYTSAKKTKMLFITSVISALLNFVLNILLIPKFEIVGASFATIVCYLAVFVIRFIDSRKIMILEIKIYEVIIGGFIVMIIATVNYIEIPQVILMNAITLFGLLVFIIRSFTTILMKKKNEI